jgi:hypothetical protein
MKMKTCTPCTHQKKSTLYAIRFVPPENLLQYLLERDLSTFDLVCDAPSTDASIDQKVKSLSESADRWLYQLLSEPKNQPQHSWFGQQITASLVKTAYIDYVHNEDNVGGKPNAFIWKKLHKFDIIKTHTTKNSNQGYYVTFPDVITLQKKFALVCFKLKNHRLVFPQ